MTYHSLWRRNGIAKCGDQSLGININFLKSEPYMSYEENQASFCC